MADDVIPVKVVVRVRPFVPKEIKEGCQQTMQYFVEQNQLIIRSKEFAFDAVFDPSASQQSVYDICAAQLVDKLFDGYNCTIFAYGQTGSGKTYTMGTEQLTGEVDDDRLGVTPRIVNAIFARVATLLEQKNTIDASCSMLEIYNEKVRDLLDVSDKAEQQSLEIRESQKTGVFVAGLTEMKVESGGETLGQLERGCSNRSRGETAMNSSSSRSHAVFSLHLKKAMDTGVEAWRSKLHLVDLAGSERLKKTHASGVRMEEGIKINEGLLALGNVISALTENRSHVPYRDSKLTRLLQDSLGGNSYTVMVACVSPSDSNCDETLSTLNYARRAKMIKNRPIINRDPREALIQRLQQENLQLREELGNYRCGGIGGAANMADASHGVTAGTNEQLMALRERVLHLEQENSRMKTDNAGHVAKLTLRLTQAEMDLENFRDAKQKLIDKFDSSGTAASNQEIVEWLNLFNAELPDCQDEKDENATAENDDDDEGEYDGDGTAAGRLETCRDRQTVLSEQVDDLVNLIKEKERLVQKTMESCEQMQEHQNKHQLEMDRLQSKIDEIEKEKTKLGEELRRLNNSNMVNENRRKKMQQLESELQSSRKQLQELKRLEKLKAESDTNIKKLKDDIMELKRVRIKMVKELKQEAEKFRKCQLKYEKEMNHLKNKDRKREMETERVKRDFDKQLNVQRRKVEEAAALNRRLQQQLRAQELIRNKKFTDAQDDAKFMKEIRAVLEHEVALSTGNEEAKLMCDSLIDQRRQLTRDLNKAVRKMNRLSVQHSSTEDDAPPVKKCQTTNDKGELTANTTMDSDQLQLNDEINRLKQEIELRNIEIEQLQAKCTSFDSAVKEDNRWAQIKVLAHAKCALKLLFEMLIVSNVNRLQFNADLESALATSAQQKEKLSVAEEQVKTLKKSIANAEHQVALQMNELSLQQQRELAMVVEIIHKDNLDDGDKEKLHCVLMNLDNLEQLQEKAEEVKKCQQYIKRTASTANRRRFFQDVIESKPQNAPIQRTRSRIVKAPERMTVDWSKYSTRDSDAHNTSTEKEDADSDYTQTPKRARRQHLAVSTLANTKGTTKAASTTLLPKPHALMSEKPAHAKPNHARLTADVHRRLPKKLDQRRKGQRQQSAANAQDRHECSEQCACDRAVCLNRLNERRSESTDEEKALNTTFNVNTTETDESAGASGGVFGGLPTATKVDGAKKLTASKGALSSRIFPPLVRDEHRSGPLSQINPSK